MKKKIVAFLLVILLAVNLFPLYTMTADAYEKDIHYWLKFKLAIYCGFTPEEARLIGTGDFGIDANYSTEPTKLDLIPTFSTGQHTFHTNIKMEKHALPRHNPVSNPDKGITEIAGQQDKLFREATSTTSVQNNYSLKLIKFGQFLHYLEDKWSHWGSTYEIGHAIPNIVGKSPDNPYNSKQATKDMIFDVMIQLGNLKGPNSRCYDSSFSKPDVFISPVNFPDDFKDKYPGGVPKDPSGKDYPNFQKERDDYFNKLDNSNPTDKISDVYNDLIKTAHDATNEGKSLEEVVEKDAATIQEHIAKELNMKNVAALLEKYDFIPPWDLSTFLGFAIPFFSTELDQGIHWDEDEQPKQPINPDPNHVFDNPQIKKKGSTTPSNPITPPPIVPKPPPKTGLPAGAANLKTATILVIKHVINDGGGTAKASDFTITADHGPSVEASPYTFPGSESGTVVTLTGKFNGMAHYAIHEHSDVLKNYDVRKSEHCNTYINANETLTCIIYNKFRAPSQTSMTEQSSGTSNNLIPGWIKKNANWYVEGKTSEEEFAAALGYLAVQNIIPTYLDVAKDTSVSVNNDPSIENDLQSTAKEWVSGAIPDLEFVGFVNDMMTNNIIEFSTKIKPVKIELTDDVIIHGAVILTAHQRAFEQMLEITNHNQKFFEDSSDKYWDLYSDSKDESQMQEALKFDNLASSAQGDAKLIVQGVNDARAKTEKFFDLARDNNFETSELKVSIEEKLPVIVKENQIETLQDLKDAYGVAREFVKTGHQEYQNLAFGIDTAYTNTVLIQPVEQFWEQSCDNPDLVSTLPHKEIFFESNFAKFGLECRIIAMIFSDTPVETVSEALKEHGSEVKVQSKQGTYSFDGDLCDPAPDDYQINAIWVLSGKVEEGHTADIMVTNQDSGRVFPLEAYIKDGVVHGIANIGITPGKYILELKNIPGYTPSANDKIEITIPPPDCKSEQSSQSPQPQNDPPTVDDIIAILNPPTTTYSVDATDPDGDSLTYTWTNSNKCGTFTFSGKTATWSHPHPPCENETYHPGIITVTVDDGHDHKVTKTYDKGSQDSSGIEIL